MKEINTWPYGNWRCVRCIGSGSYGKVYEIEREEFGKVYRSALKVIRIPQSPEEIEIAFSEQMDKKEVADYYQGLVKSFTDEFSFLSDMKGYTHIVSYEDHMVLPHEDGIGMDILIRMELLTPLREYTKSHPFAEIDVIRLGTELCSALEICRQKQILHRDIKIDNIFVNEEGRFKLGDFGIARLSESTMSTLSVKGTYNYMAPEVYNHEHYGHTADLYSLGMVLYRYLNRGRGPFLPSEGKITHQDRETALLRQVHGEAIPAPVYGSKALQSVILKILSARPEDRFQTAAELQDALQACRLPESKEAAPSEAPAPENRPEPLAPLPKPVFPKAPEKSFRSFRYLLSLLLLLLLILSGFYVQPSYKTRDEPVLLPSQSEDAAALPQVSAATESPKPDTPTPLPIPAVNTLSGTELSASFRSIRSQIRHVYVTGGAQHTRGSARDISEEKNRSIFLWTEKTEDGFDLHIASKGIILMPADCSSLFEDYVNCQSIAFSSCDFSFVTSMNRMFLGCESLKEMDFSDQDFGSVTDMEAMFYRCTSLETVSLKNVDASRVRTMESLFGSCSSLKQVRLKGLRAESVKHLDSMFSFCESLDHLNMSEVNMDQVTSMDFFLYGCRKLTSADLSGIHPAHLKSMVAPFSSNDSLQRVNLTGFDDCPLLDLDLLIDESGRRLRDVAIGLKG